MGHGDIPQSPWTFFSEETSVQCLWRALPTPDLLCAPGQSCPLPGSSGPTLPLLPQGTVLCDIILLNFLKGADQYKAKKFEEVRGAHEAQRDRAGRGRGPQGLSGSPSGGF